MRRELSVENPSAMKFCGQCGTQLARCVPGVVREPARSILRQCSAALISPSPGVDPLVTCLSFLPPGGRAPGLYATASGREDPALAQRLKESAAMHCPVR
jgi:hypothetical protein